MEDYLLCTILYILLVGWLFSPTPVLTTATQSINYFPDVPSELPGDDASAG